MVVAPGDPEIPKKGPGGEADLKTVDMALSSAGTAASQELAEVLESETLVDMTTLLSLCAHGIPDRLRGDAWKCMSPWVHG